jgi:hypothetical protein
VSKANSERASARSWGGVRLTRVEQRAIELYPDDGTSQPFSVRAVAYLKGRKEEAAERRKRKAK